MHAVVTVLGPDPAAAATFHMLVHDLVNHAHVNEAAHSDVIAVLDDLSTHTSHQHNSAESFKINVSGRK